MKRPACIECALFYPCRLSGVIVNLFKSYMNEFSFDTLIPTYVYLTPLELGEWGSVAGS